MNENIIAEYLIEAFASNNWSLDKCIALFSFAETQVRLTGVSDLSIPPLGRQGLTSFSWLLSFLGSLFELEVQERLLRRSHRINSHWLEEIGTTDTRQI